MSAAGFDATQAFTMDEEKGYQDDPEDSGNYASGKIGAGPLVGTNFGISAPILSSWLGRPATREDMLGLSQDAAKAIFRAIFWDACRADTLPLGLDLMTVDFGFNAGAPESLALYNRQAALTLPSLGILSDATCVKHAQAKLGVDPDGIVGRLTIGAAVDRGMGDALRIAALGSMQAAAYRHMRAFSRFGKDWIARTEDRVVMALSLAYPTKNAAEA
ncbi:MAG: glycosyl hydrolase 108 family protein [Acetobacter aceti]